MSDVVKPIDIELVDNSSTTNVAATANSTPVSNCNHDSGNEDESKESSVPGGEDDDKIDATVVTTKVSNDDDIGTTSARGKTKAEYKKDMGNFIVYLIFVISLTYATTLPINSQDIYYLGASLREQLVDEEFTSSDTHILKTWKSVATVSEMYQYIGNVVVPQIYPGSATYDDDDSYPSLASNSTSDSKLNSPGLISGFNHLVGGIRISQVRIKPLDDCGISASFKPNSYIDKFECQSRFIRFTDETMASKSYGYPQPIYDKVTDPDQIRGSTNYRSPTTLVLYPSPNYAVTIPNNATIEEAQSIVADMIQYKWTDIRTAVVFVDINVYNPSLDMLAHMRLVCEFFPSGGVYTNTETLLSKLYSGTGYHSSKAFYSKCWVAFIVLCLFMNFLGDLLRRIRLSPKKLLSGLVIVKTINFVLIFIWLYYDFVFDEMLTDVDFDSAEYYATRRAQFLLKYSRDASSFASFYAWMQIFHYLNYVPAFKLILETAKSARKHLLYFFMVLGVVFFASGQAFMIIFGTQLYGYRNLSQSMFSLMRAVVGDFNFEELRTAQPIFGPILFGIFLVVVVFSLFNMFIAIISDAFDETKRHIEANEEFDSAEFFQEMLRVCLDFVFHKFLFKIPFLKIGFKSCFGPCLNHLEKQFEEWDKMRVRNAARNIIDIDALDINKDGSVSTNELKTLFDVDGDNVIGVKEVKSKMEALTGTRGLSYSGIDLNGDGRVDSRELKNFASVLNEESSWRKDRHDTASITSTATTREGEDSMKKSIFTGMMNRMDRLENSQTEILRLLKTLVSERK